VRIALPQLHARARPGSSSLRSVAFCGKYDTHARTALRFHRAAWTSFGSGVSGPPDGPLNRRSQAAEQVRGVQLSGSREGGRPPSRRRGAGRCRGPLQSAYEQA
jgi:hypothetical protein